MVNKFVSAVLVLKLTTIDGLMNEVLRGFNASLIAIEIKLSINLS